MNKEGPNEEDQFVGEIQERPAEQGSGSEMSMEQRVEWLEAKDALEERLKAIDPAFSVEFDDTGLDVGVLDSMLLRMKKAPGLFVKHEDLYLLGIQGRMLNPRELGAERFKKDLDRHVDAAARRLQALRNARKLKP